MTLDMIILHANIGGGGELDKEGKSDSLNSLESSEEMNNYTNNYLIWNGDVG